MDKYTTKRKALAMNIFGSKSGYLPIIISRNVLQNFLNISQTSSSARSYLLIDPL